MINMEDNKALLGGAEEIVAALERACHDCNPTPCCEYKVENGDFEEAAHE